MNELSVGTTVGLFIIGMIAVLVVDHYRRKNLREKLLQRTNHHWWDSTRHRS